MTKFRFGYQDGDHAQLFFLCWVAYFSTYICRLNYSAVMPEISAAGLYGESQIAAVSSAFFICYGAGQLFSGSIGDRISPRIMIFWGVAISAISNILIFFFYDSFAALLLLWGINGAVQSMVWSPVLRVAGEYFCEKEKNKFGIDISTTVPLGTLASYGVSLVTVLVLPWRFVFLTCGAVVLLAAIYWWLGTKRVMRRLQANPSGDAPEGYASLQLKKLFKLLLSCGVLLALVSIVIQGTLKDSVTQWIPTFLSQGYHTGTGVSLALTMILPIINVTGAYFAKALFKKLPNEMTVSAVFFAVAGVFLILLTMFGQKNLVLALVCMAGVTNCMFAINVMLITMVPLRFSVYGRVSTVAGLLNATAYIGCGVLNLAAGSLLEHGGDWHALFVLWLALAWVAVAVTLVCAGLWKRFSKKA